MFCGVCTILAEAFVMSGITCKNNALGSRRVAMSLCAAAAMQRFLQFDFGKASDEFGPSDSYLPIRCFELGAVCSKFTTPPDPKLLPFDQALLHNPA